MYIVYTEGAAVNARSDGKHDFNHRVCTPEPKRGQREIEQPKCTRTPYNSPTGTSLRIDRQRDAVSWALAKHRRSMHPLFQHDTSAPPLSFRGIHLATSGIPHLARQGLGHPMRSGRLVPKNWKYGWVR